MGTVLNVPDVYPCRYPLASCRLTGSTNFVDSLQSIYGLPGLTNYSIGGARTNNSNTLSGLDGPPLPPNYGFPYELQQFAANSTHFTNTDLIALSIGGNDLSAIDPRNLTTDAQRRADRIERCHLGEERGRRRGATGRSRRPQHRLAQHWQFEVFPRAAQLRAARQVCCLPVLE